MSARTLQHFVNNILIELGWKKVVQVVKRQIKICWTNKFVCMSNLRMLHTRTHTGRHNSCGININYSYLLRHRGVQFTLWSVAWWAVVSHATAKFSTIQFWNWRRDWNCELDTKTGSGNSVWVCVRVCASIYPLSMVRHIYLKWRRALDCCWTEAVIN